MLAASNILTPPKSAINVDSARELGDARLDFR